MPHVFVGDDVDAFALKPHMMKPYSQNGLSADRRVYSYRHSQARRLSENLFGIMANRWCVFLTLLLLSPQSVVNVVLTTLILHNYLEAPHQERCTALLEQAIMPQLRPNLYRKPSRNTCVMNVPLPGSGKLVNNIPLGTNSHLTNNSSVAPPC